MSNHRVAIMAVAAATLFLGVLVAAGCGGGGPLKQSPPATAVAAFMQLLPAGQKSAARVGDAKCAPCHAVDHTSWMATQHAKALVDCEACHGPGSAHVAAPNLTNILSGINSTNVAVCGQCHSQELTDWTSSVHSQIVADPVSSGSNNCYRCHSGAFRAQYVDSPIALGQTPAQVDSAIDALSTATLNTYKTATTASVVCSDCHNPHANTSNLTSAGNQYYLERATSSTDLSSDQPNASVAQYTTVDQICGSCHNNRGGDPSDAGLQANTSRPATHEGPEYNMLNGYGGNEGPGGPPTRTSSHVAVPDQCAHCHMPNNSHTMTVALDVSCAPCHTPTDAASRETTLQTEIEDDLVALRTRMQNWAQTTFGDPNVWDYTTNIPSTSKAPNQALIPIQIKRSRHNYYFILLDRSSGVHNADYTTYLLDWSNTNLDALGISRGAVPKLSTKEARAILNQDIGQVRSANAKPSSM